MNHLYTQRLGKPSVSGAFTGQGQSSLPQYLIALVAMLSLILGSFQAKAQATQPACGQSAYVDWISRSGNTTTGVIRASTGDINVTITFTNPPNAVVGDIGAPGTFTSNLYTPPESSVESILAGARKAGGPITSAVITFSPAITDPVIHISVLDYAGIRITNAPIGSLSILSGNAQLTISNNGTSPQISDNNSNIIDSNTDCSNGISACGSVKVTGTYTQLNFQYYDAGGNNVDGHFLAFSTSGAATCPAISGNVFTDANGLLGTPANTVDGPGVNGTTLGLYASLVQGGTVVATVPVTATGTYSFTGVPTNSTYNVVLTTNSAGNATPSVPAGYINTGENIGTTAGSDGTPNGSLAVTVATTPITNANFGIQQVPTPFTCSNLAYQVAGPLGQNSNLFSYNVATGVRTLIAPLGTEVNAIGYNQVDNLIWGYNRNTDQVIRIDATGARTNFNIPNLPVLPYFVGTVLPGGYLVMGGGGGRYYTIDINPARPTTYLRLVDPTAGYVLDGTAPFGNAISNSQGFSDYAYNPATGLIQGIVDGDAASNPRRLFSLDPTTGVLTLGPTATGGGNIGAENGAFGAVFFDATGFLYAFGNESGKFFRINLSTGGTTLVSTSTPSENNDGASCPTAVLVPTIDLSGNVLNDANGLIDNTVSGTAVNGPSIPVYVSLVQGGTVVTTVPVTATGTYSFTSVLPGSYSVVLTTNPAGSATPSVPASFTNTGENIGTTPGSDGTPNGILAVTVGTTSVTNANFGIEQRPVGVAATDTPRPNPGGTTASPVSPSVFTGTDPEDNTYPNNLTGRTVTLSPATNGTLFYGGTPVTSTTTITGFDPTLVSIDPTAPGATTGNDPTFTYSVNDNAGVPSVPQTITVPFTAVAAPGYIYVHKKALSEDVSPDFPFTVSGGPTSVPGITLNDQATNLSVLDLGATGNGGLYAVAGPAAAGTNGSPIYYRAVNSSSWTQIGGEALRIDGGPANTNVHVNAIGDVFYYNGTTTTNLNATTAVDVAFDRSGTNRVFYTAANGTIFYKNVTSPGASFSIVNGFNATRIDVAPNGLLVSNSGNGEVYVSNFNGSGSVSLGNPSSLTGAATDVTVADDGTIYASKLDNTGSVIVFRYTGGYAAGGSWVAEPTSRGINNITGGVASQVWGQFVLNGVTRSIWSRTASGVWLDDERVRTSPNSNSELVAVAPGTYTVTEGAVSGWALSSISFDDPSNNSTGNVSGSSASVNVSSGEVVHVTFQNNLIQSTAVTNTCTSPAFLETFGTGSTSTSAFGPPLTGQTTYHYASVPTVQDGYYGVVSNTNQIGGFGGNFNDHTSGDGTGRLAFFNANYAQDEFYRRRFTGLLPGVQYSFSAWVLNVNNAPIKPNVRFEVNDPSSGANLATNNTGDVTTVGVWQQYQLVFTATQSSIDVVLRNNNIGGDGNDLAIDDISFGLAAPLQPVVSVTNANCTTATGSITVSSPLGASIEYSIDGTTFQSSPTFTSVAPGSFSVTARFTGSVGCVSAPTAITISAAICGNVLTDANGLTDNIVNGPGVNGPALPVYVSLVSGGSVIATVPVTSTGAYSFTNVTPGSYSVVLTTNPAGSPTPSIPASFTNTGENIGTTPGSDGTPNGILPVTVGTTSVTNANFGIEQRPVGLAATDTPRPNPGGTTASPVSPSVFTGTDPEDNTYPNNLTGRTVTLTPATNGTLFYGGTPVTSTTTITGFDPTLVSIDPTAPGATTGNDPTFTYSVNDNAGVPSVPQTITVPFTAPVVSISGNVFNDTDALTDMAVDGPGVNGPTLPVYASLVQSGTVVATVPVTATGSYIFTGVAPGSYSVVISTNPSGSAIPSVPTNFTNTGENIGTGPGNDGTPDGSLAVTVASSPVTDVNFGIEQLPTAGSGSVTVSNPGGTTPIPVPTASFTNTTPSGDVAPGTVASIRITAFPTNTTSLTINGTPYTPGSFPAGGIVVPTDGSGNPTVPILVDPTNDATPVSIPFRAIDNGGIESPNTGTAVLNFTPTTSLSGNVFNDTDALTDNTVDGPGVNGPLLPVYASLVQSGTVVATVLVNASGAYTFTGVAPGSYSVVISTNPSGSATPSVPTNFTNTGENVGTGPGSDGTPDGSLAVTVGGTPVTDVNFGIEQLPTAGSGSVTVSNPGGTTGLPVPPASFTNTTPSSDPTPGLVTSIRITGFPTNTTSLTINGTPYTPGTFPTGGVIVPTDGSGNPTVPILVDPTNDASPVSIPFRAIDNGGKESPNTGTAVLNFTPTTSLSGNVFNDANGLTDNTVSGTAVNGPALPVYASLVQGGTLIATVPVTSAGSYTFTSVTPGSYSVVLTTNPAGSLTPGIPASYINTGENLGAGAGSDGTPDGSLAVTVGATPVTDANFGIEQRPVGVAATDSPRSNPGGTTASPVSPTVFTGTDPEDGTYPNNLTGRTVTLSPATNGTLFYNGTPVTSTTAITGFDPTLVSIDPTAPGATTGNDPTFTYSVNDNAGVPSTPQTITVPFTANCLLAVDLTVSPNVCIGATVTLSASTTGATGTVTYTFTGPLGFSVVTTASSVSIASAVLGAAGAYTVVVTDASSCSATATASVTVNNCTSLSGNVFNDTDALTDMTVDGPGVNGPTLPVYVSLVQSGTVVATVPVTSVGSYTFTGVAPGSYSVVISTNPSGSATPSVPTNFTNTGENVGAGPGNDGTPDGSLAVTVGGSPVTDVNFGIEQLPTAGSGTNPANNSGGTTGVIVPASTFTNTTPSGDVAPGTVVSIRITGFPTNTTSLTVNGTVYTPGSFPAGGVVVPTDGSGNPSVPILVDPTNDGLPVSILFRAVDNGGIESPNTGTAVLTPVPDLTPVIFARPSTVYNTTTMTVVVDVWELLSVPTSGLITVKVSKDARFEMNFDQMATSVNGRSVQNSAWTYQGIIGGMYTFTTNNVIAGNVGTGKLSFGMTGTLTPGATTGTLTVSTAIVGGSGGEIRIDNNNDADKIDYFQQ